MKQIEKAYVFRLYRTERQAILIFKTIGCSCFVYNHFLARRSARYQETGRTLGYAKCSGELTILKQHGLSIFGDSVGLWTMKFSVCPGG
jgi:putative transposase